MSTLWWALTAVLALLWTLVAWVSWEVASFLLGLWPAQGLSVAWPDPFPWPAWVTLWWPREGLDAMLALVRDLTQWLSVWSPSAQTWLGLIGWAIALGWLLGQIVLWGAALGVHLWQHRRKSVRTVRA